MFGHNLDDDIQSDLSGDLCRVMRSLVSGNRDANHTVDLNLAKNQLRNLELSNVQLSTKMANFENKKYQLLKLAEISELDKTNLNKTFST